MKKSTKTSTSNGDKSDTNVNITDKSETTATKTSADMHANKGVAEQNEMVDGNPTAMGSTSNSTSGAGALGMLGNYSSSEEESD